MSTIQRKIKLALLTGGPSPERSISLNSSRSVLDNLAKDQFEIKIVYFDLHKNPYLIPLEQLYSNTVSDFEFKIKEIGKPLKEQELWTLLGKEDLVWPLMHGEFGEDGEIQVLLEKEGINFLGSPSQACRQAMDKYACQQALKEAGFFTFGTKLIRKGESLPRLEPGEYVIKPNWGGSSIGVEFFNPAEADWEKQIERVFQYGEEAALELLCPGQEFTLIVMENEAGEPVSFIPTEVQFKEGDNFLSFRKKYLATSDIHFHTPPRFPLEKIIRIRKEAGKAYRALGLRDYARFDGWLMPDGKIWFSDINPISGMEQNSFIFRQAAFLGLNHADLLRYLVFSTLRRRGVITAEKGVEKLTIQPKKKVAVIFGGGTAERQISLLSGTNVWIKLKSSLQYQPSPIFLDQSGKFWLIPHFFCLHHTVEEIEYLIKQVTAEKIKEYKKLAQGCLKRLGVLGDWVEEPLFLPKPLTLAQIKKEFAFVFLGLHGGMGEDGTMQKKLKTMGLPFNGSQEKASALGMDKWQTGKVIEKASIKGVLSLKKKLIKVGKVRDASAYWKKLKDEFQGKDILLKPRGDGCSAGVVKINDEQEFAYYLNYIRQGACSLPQGLLRDHQAGVELPSAKCQELLAEEYVSTDAVEIKGRKIVWQKEKGWIELSVGVLGNGKNLKALTPSQTIAEGKVLSVEEKFQGGTGINFTPPPKKYVGRGVVLSVKKRVALAAQALKIEGYARLDCFLNTENEDLIIIEANTLPALTPSTIIYHQALQENPPLNPLQFIEKVIELGFEAAETGKD